MERLTEQEPNKKWWQSGFLKGMGLGVFLFFFLKGLVWLAVIFGLFKFVSC